jgi:uncharacterized delta-60 repeat protein
MRMSHRSLLGSLLCTLVAVLLVGLAGLPSAHAAVGDLDPLNLMLDERVSATVAQPDGKTILVGRFTSVLGEPRNRIARLNADGSLDMGFNPNVNSAGATVECVAVQADGRVVIGGSFSSVNGTPRNRIARLNANGSLDESFNPNPDGPVNCLAVRRDGKVLLGGFFVNLQPGGVGLPVQRVGIARVDTNGIPDNFNPLLNNGVRSLVLQPDDTVLIGGDFTSGVVRLTPLGTKDPTFTPQLSSVQALAVQADGHVLIGGGFNTVSGVTRLGIARVTATGVLDSFNPNLPFVGAAESVKSIAVQADGQVLLSGKFTVLKPNGIDPGTPRSGVARVTANGELDPGFYPKPSSPAGSDVWGIGLQADGKVLLGGPFTVFDQGLPTATNRRGFARLENDPATQSLTVPSASEVLWTRGGSSPECSVVTFELSTDGGATWTPLGPDPYGLGTRVGTTANWQLTGLSLSGSGQIRARGVTTGGFYNGSAGLVEAFASFTAPEVAVTGNGVGIADGDATPSDTDHTDFGNVDLAGGAQVRTFIITNTGTAELTLGNFTVGGDHPADFPVTPPQLEGPLAPGGSTTFQVTFDPTALGLRRATLSFVNNDADENPYDFSIQGTGYVPGPGDPDPAVDNSGISGVRAVAVQPDGKTIIAGSFTSVKGVARNRIARLNADHSVDPTFDPNVGSVTPPANEGELPEVFCVAVQADGRVLLGGSFTTVGGTQRNYLARLEANGSLDGSFNPSAYGFINCLAVQADGQVLAGYGPATFPGGGGVVGDFIVRLNATNGSKDPSFTGGANNQVFSLAVQGDGKVVVGGAFDRLAGGGVPFTVRNHVGRLEANGAVDPGFNPNANNVVLSVAVQADGAVLLGGWFTALQPGGAGPVTARNRIARVTASGTPDGFDPNADGRVHGLAVQADGQVLFGGSFNAVDGTPRDGIARVNANGTLDPVFSGSAGSPVNVAVRADGKVLVNGRLLGNGAAIQSLTAPAADQVLWSRGGTAPELSLVTFELSTDEGATWNALGAGVRAGTTANWQLTGLSLPPSGRLRARGVTGNGGSSGLVETVADFGVSPGPEIAVSGNGVVILDGDATPVLGDHTDFGNVNVTGGTLVRTFTIENIGQMPLTVGNVTVSGPAAADFAVTTQPASPVLFNFNTTFEVTFNPSVVGLREATLSFGNNDAFENPYDFAIRGTGTLAASLPPPVVVSGADVVVAFVGEPGRRYRVQYLTGFRPPLVWADFIPPATFTAPASGVIRHTDRSPGDSTRFYRTIPNP